MLKVGDTFTFEGVELEVVAPIEGRSCLGCYFVENPGCSQQDCCDTYLNYFVIIKEIKNGPAESR